MISCENISRHREINCIHRDCKCFHHAHRNCFNLIRLKSDRWLNKYIFLRIELYNSVETLPILFALKERRNIYRTKKRKREKENTKETKINQHWILRLRIVEVQSSTSLSLVVRFVFRFSCLHVPILALMKLRQFFCLFIICFNGYVLLLLTYKSSDL